MPLANPSALAPLAAALALGALVLAAPASAEPVCQDVPSAGMACAEAIGGPEAGGAGVVLVTPVSNSCVAAFVSCPVDED